MFICTTQGIPPGTRLLCSPSTTAAKKLPNRTLSPDKRLIWDGRRVNLHCPKQGYWFLETPLVRGLARWYVRTQTLFPGIPIEGGKRDVDSAFTRCRLHPDASSMFSTEFIVEIGNGETGIIFFYMVLPFGFSGSPGIFGRVMQGVKWLHSLFSPTSQIWDGAQPFNCEIFAGDGMFIEARLGTRQKQCVEKWEWAATRFLGDTAIIKTKLELEGEWSKELLLLGFHVDLKLDEITPPDPKIVGAYNLLHLNVFNPGNYTIPLQTMQELRGSLNHWSNTNRIWKWLSEPINQMLGQTDTNLLWIRCSDPEKWLAFWHVILFIREVADDECNWRKLPKGCFTELVGVHAEMSLPNPGRRRLWFSGDATPSCFAGINWDSREFFYDSPRTSPNPFYRWVVSKPTSTKSSSLSKCFALRYGEMTPTIS